MPVGTALAIAGIASAAASTAGTIVNTVKGGDYGTIPAPKPNALYPDINKQFLSYMKDSVGPDVMQALDTLIKTGMPTDFAGGPIVNTMGLAPTNVGDAWDRLVASQKQQADIGRANILEQFGAAGTRYGSDAMGAVGRYEGQLNKDYASILSNYTMQANEAAAGRQFQAGESALQRWFAAQEQAKQRQAGAVAGAADTYANAGMAMTPSAFIAPGQGTGTQISNIGKSVAATTQLPWSTWFPPQASAPVGGGVKNNWGATGIPGAP